MFDIADCQLPIADFLNRENQQNWQSEFGNWLAPLLQEFGRQHV
jgi:hypothetical protein